MKRIENTVQDLVTLDHRFYCELGPGDEGAISTGLRRHDKNVVAVEAPWLEGHRFEWAEKAAVKMYLMEFFTGDFNQIEEPVDCFILAHSIAHFRFTPYILFKKIYDRLPVGGKFYLSTVNGGSFERVYELFRGIPITGRVSQETAPKYVEGAKYFNKTDMHQIWDDWMHVKEYTKGELEEIFVNTGFKIHKSYYRNNFFHWKRNLVTGMFPNLSEEIIVIGEK